MPHLLQQQTSDYLPLILTAVVVSLIFIFFVGFLISRYKRCPANRILVIYGKGVGERAARCIHGGGAFVWPVIQDYAYLSLEPMTIDIDLTGALSLRNIRVNVPATFTIGVSAEPSIMFSAAERILGLPTQQISTQAQDIIVGQLRLVIATLSIEEINQDREKFLKLIGENVNIELNKIGLEVINVNIRDITDDSGYIDAIGRKAAAEAVNVAKIDVAKAEKEGETGKAREDRERTVVVAREAATAVEGKKEAERNQRIAVARLEAEGASSEAMSLREKDVNVAREVATTVEGRKEAERKQRVTVATYEAEAITGENTAKADIAARNAALAEAEAEANRRSHVAQADAQRQIFQAEQKEELARLEKEQIVMQEIEKRRIEIAAEAEAERSRRVARGEADATLARYSAEAEGVRRVLEAKADGYRKLVEACATRPDIAPTLLMIEKLPDLVHEQVKAISNLKIDKITVWDSGHGNGDGKSSTANFLSSIIGALPPVHELAKQAGVELPGFLGRFADTPKPTGAKHDAHDGDVKK